MQDPNDEEEQANVAKAVASARNACKMKYIVGCAPVVYGIPVSMSKANPGI